MRLTFCTLCGENDPTALEHHHYRPKALGGTDDETNMFTVCGTCHGMVHDIPRPLRLGELVKVGQAKVAERTVDDWQGIAAAKARQAEDAEAKALELAQQEARDATKALKRLVADAKRSSRPEVSSPPLVPHDQAGAPRSYGPYDPSRRATLRARRVSAVEALHREASTIQMQKDKQFRTSGCWALATDGIQWVVQRRAEGGKHWTAVKFIRSTKVNLAGCLPPDAQCLLDGLPDTFDEWWEANGERLKACHDVSDGGEHPTAVEPVKSAMAPAEAKLARRQQNPDDDRDAAA